jgi:hypothetical protein
MDARPFRSPTGVLFHGVRGASPAVRGAVTTGRPDAVDDLIISISRRMSSALDDVVERHTALYLDMYPRLADNDELVILLRSAVRESISAELEHISRPTTEHEIHVPAMMSEWARRIAQRGLPLTDTLRAHRRGQALFLQQFLVEIGSATDDPALGNAAALRVNERSFAIHDNAFSARIAEAYDQEREKWVHTRATVLRAAVTELVASGVTDVDATERVLGYRLRRRHVAVIAWIPVGATDGPPGRGLESTVRAFADELGCREAPLCVLHDESTLWGWLPIESLDTDAAERALRRVENDPGLRIAMGEPGSGVPGFRLSHRQAVQARAVAWLSQLPSAPNVVRYRDVGLVAMLCADIDGAAMWVDATLGALAVDTPTNSKLRHTLEIFLESGGSFVATAELLGIHRNTVKYRVDQAEEIRTRPATEGRLDLELALRACRLLGAAVLRDE